MDTTLLINASQQSALGRRMDIVANNLANMSTTGFKGEMGLFQNYLEQVRGEGPRSLTEVNYVLDYGTIRSLEDGPVQVTQNPLDIALQGDGFFAVADTETGETRYTRRGNLTQDTAGFLALAGSGERVLDDNDQPIQTAPGDGTLTISSDGTVSGENGVIAQMGLARFNDERALFRLGNGLYDPGEEAPQPVDDLTIVQGAVEGSNVNAIREVTEMIQVMRAYQSAKDTADEIAELRDQAIERLPRANR